MESRRYPQRSWMRINRKTRGEQVSCAFGRRLPLGETLPTLGGAGFAVWGNGAPAVLAGNGLSSFFIRLSAD